MNITLKEVTIDIDPANLSTYDRTYFALQSLYLNSLEGQTMAKKFDWACNPSYKDDHCTAHSYVNEYCTIKLTSARQTGHSSAIAKFLTTVDGNWLVLSGNHAMSNRFNRVAKSWLELSDHKIMRSTMDEITTDKPSSIFYGTHDNQTVSIGRELNGVIIDQASCLKRKRIKEIQSCFFPAMSKNEFQTFILVQ